MILYTLVCDDGHRFDSWFRNADAFDDQSSAGHLACPVCRSDQVVKAVMAPAVVGQRDAARSKDASVLLDPQSRDMRTLLRNVREKVLAEGHDVGPQFATEAWRIHEGEAPNRQIYGQASIGEARELVEDGILVLPLPIVPDELN